MKLGICGARSTIAQAFVELCDEEAYFAQPHAMRLDLDRYLICTGYLAGKQLNDLSEDEAAKTWALNFLEPAKLCDRIFECNASARVCVIGSHSGFEGSYDMAYAGAKAALHRYVSSKKLTEPDQMLVALAPHVVWDTAMTGRRNDLGELAERGRATRLTRWLNSHEVAREAVHLLYLASPAVSGQVIRMRAS